MKKIIYLIGTFFLTLVMFLPSVSQARDPNQIIDWYAKKLTSDIQVNKDSSLLITEKIVADCGNLPYKHGIYRILPTQIKTKEGDVFKYPIHLISITDFNNKPYKYTTTNSRLDHTLTWKIGDPNITVTGENNYQIIYRIENAIRFQNDKFDELYWNLLGTFWQMDIDEFTANINFPSEITQKNTQMYYYTGTYGSQSQDLAKYQWINTNTLQFVSTQTIPSGNGVTLSMAFPKNIFTPYKPGFFETYGLYFAFLLPIFLLFLSYRVWSKYGRDPKINPTIVPEFEIPNKLAPMELGTVSTNGAFKNNFISAAIINLAVKDIIRIEKINKKGVFSKEGHKLIRTKKSLDNLTSSEKLLLEKILDNKDSIEMSSLKNKFYKDIPAVSEAVTEPLKADNLIQNKGRWLLGCFLTLGLIIFFISFSSFAFGWQVGLSLFLSGLIVMIYGVFMPKRPLEGAQLNKKIEGFRLYMTTAEKYRQRFNEKENIFEKFLPYAIVFGITTLWINKMKQIYGEEYFQSYHPVWFYGASLASFNANSFNSSISDLSSSMASTLASSPSSSSGFGGGGGGGGFSGGGGGGGGGGGW